MDKSHNPPQYQPTNEDVNEIIVTSRPTAIPITRTQLQALMQQQEGTGSTSVVTAKRKKKKSFAKNIGALNPWKKKKCGCSESGPETSVNPQSSLPDLFAGINWVFQPTSPRQRSPSPKQQRAKRAGYLPVRNHDEFYPGSVDEDPARIYNNIGPPALNSHYQIPQGPPRPIFTTPRGRADDSDVLRDHTYEPIQVPYERAPQRPRLSTPRRRAEDSDVSQDRTNESKLDPILDESDYEIPLMGGPLTRAWVAAHRHAFPRGVNEPRSIERPLEVPQERAPPRPRFTTPRRRAEDSDVLQDDTYESKLVPYERAPPRPRFTTPRRQADDSDVLQDDTYESKLVPYERAPPRPRFTTPRRRAHDNDVLQDDTYLPILDPNLDESGYELPRRGGPQTLAWAAAQRHVFPRGTHEPSSIERPLPVPQERAPPRPRLPTPHGQADDSDVFLDRTYESIPDPNFSLLVDHLNHTYESLELFGDNGISPDRDSRRERSSRGPPPLPPRNPGGPALSPRSSGRGYVARSPVRSSGGGNPGRSPVRSPVRSPAHNSPGGYPGRTPVRSPGRSPLITSTPKRWCKCRISRDANENELMTRF